MKRITEHALPLLLLLAGLIAAAAILLGRAEAERGGKSYDLVLDYADMVKMVEKSEEDEDFWLRHFRALGIDKCALMEVSLKSLADAGDGRVFLTELGALTAEYGWEKRYPARVADWAAEGNSKDMLAVVTDPALYDFVVTALTERAGDDLVWERFTEGGVGFLLLHGEGKTNGTSWANLALGLEAETVQKILDAGYTLVPRTTVVRNVNTPQYGAAVLESFRQYGSPYFINGGPMVPGTEGDSDGISRFLRYLDDTGATFCLVEKATQSLNLPVAEMEDFLPASGYNAIRTFSMWGFVQARYAAYNYTGPEEIENTLYRAIYERECRLIYYKMILKPDSSAYVTDPAAYTQLLTGLRARMERLGYRQETLRAMPGYVPALPLRILVGFGGVAAAVLLLEVYAVLKKRTELLLLLAGCLGVMAAFFIAPNTSKLVLAIGCGIVYPALAAAWSCRLLNMEAEEQFKRIFVTSLLLTLAAAGVSFAGAFAAAAALSESAFMLELELYRGVKLMQLLPLAIFALTWLLVYVWEKRYGRVRTKSDWKPLRERIDVDLEESIRRRDVLRAVGFLLLAGILVA
ncbi:MAG: DUF5693 family protein, partial [bacterium]